MKTFRQIRVVTGMNFKSLPSRFWSSMVIVIGMACVIGVLLSMLSLSAGMFSAFAGSGDPGRLMITSQGAQNEGNSTISRANATLIMDAPGIMKDSDGLPLADPEVLSSIPIKKKNGLASRVLFRGFGAKGLALRPEIKIVRGRAFQPGKRELIVGVGAQAQYAGLEIGDKVAMPDGDWPIVGVFSSSAKGGDALEGNLITNVENAMQALRRPNFGAVLARLDSKPGSFDAAKKALTTNPALSLIVERHSTYYERQTKQANLVMINVIAYGVGIVMAIGALFGALNTMYAAVSARTREIATLRAIGFSAFPVAVSVIAEAALLALIGAGIGAAIAWFLYNGVQDTYGSNVFHMSVSPALIGLGLTWAVVIALLGGLFPSVRAARQPIATALRAV